MKVRCASFTTIRSAFITRRIEARSRSRRISFIATRFADQAVDLAEDVLVGQLDVEERLRDRARGGDHLALDREDLLQPPLRDLGEREQPQRLARRRAVHDHDVVVARGVVALDLQQAEQLVHARRHGQLLGRDVHHAAVGEQARQPALDLPPVVPPSRAGPAPPDPRALADRRRVRAEIRPRASRTGCGRGRSRARRCAARGPRRGGRSRPRRRSCRHRPCPCRESCVERSRLGAERR